MIRSFISAITLLIFIGCGSAPSEFQQKEQCATIYPDYSEVTFPSNIAPISLRIEDQADSYAIAVSAGEKMIYQKQAQDGYFTIPKRAWQKIVQHPYFEMQIYLKQGGEWSQYAPIRNYISDSEIDPFLTYRLIPPGYELWSQMGIYQRDLTSYKQKTIVTSKQAGGGCVNCHHYGGHSVENSMFHHRGANGGTVIRRGDNIDKVSFNSSKELIAEGIYPVWHPSNEFIAYSVNDISQYFHIKGRVGVEVSDSKSDIILYDLRTNEVIADPLLFGTPQLETFPEWSADGKTLYYSVAAAGSQEAPLDSIRYNLCSVDFDSATRSFSNRQLLIDAAPLGHSISFAKATLDGGYIVATLADYGNFSIWHNEADLIIFNTQSGEWRRATEISSDSVESYHSFSSCGEWMVFSSRRDDGLYTRPYITKFDAQSGTFTKPFMLPQQRADFYDKLFFSYNIPNFTQDEYRNPRKLLDVITSEPNLKARVVR